MWFTYTYSLIIISADEINTTSSTNIEQTEGGIQTPLTPFKSPFSRLSRGKLMMLFMFCICNQEVAVSSDRTPLLKPMQDLLHPHQVFEECRQLFGEDRELYKRRAHLDIVPAHQIFSKLLYCLNIQFLTLHMSWNTEPMRLEIFRTRPKFQQAVWCRGVDVRRHFVP